MRYSLLPFPNLGDVDGPDLLSALRARNTRATARHLSNQILVAELVSLLRDVPWELAVDACEENNGELRLAVISTGLGRYVSLGDQVCAGFYLQNSEQGIQPSLACTRIFRTVCRNGALIECEQGQSAELSIRGWQKQLSGVVEQSFDAEGLDRDTARFRSTLQQMLVTPYELLCNLVAQQIISEDEQIEIQAEFDDVGDASVYGLINAVTRIAAQCRDSSNWTRSFQLERLGGEILRGDHQAPVSEYAWR
jgi:hypothetical protein